MTAHAVRTEDIRIVTVPVRELTAAAFMPYGEVSRPASELTLDFSGGSASLFHVRLERQRLHVDFLCRHTRTTQTYMPLGASESILLVAPPSDLADPKAVPDLSKLAAFRLTGDRAVNLHRGTWHRAPMPLGPEAHFLVLDRQDTLDDCDLVDVRYNMSVAIEIHP